MPSKSSDLHSLCALCSPFAISQLGLLVPLATAPLPLKLEELGCLTFLVSGYWIWSLSSHCFQFSPTFQMRSWGFPDSFLSMRKYLFVQSLKIIQKYSLFLSIKWGILERLTNTVKLIYLGYFKRNGAKWLRDIYSKASKVQKKLLPTKKLVLHFLTVEKLPKFFDT